MVTPVVVARACAAHKRNDDRAPRVYKEWTACNSLCDFLGASCGVPRWNRCVLIASQPVHSPYRLLPSSSLLLISCRVTSSSLSPACIRALNIACTKPCLKDVRLLVGSLASWTVIHYGLLMSCVHLRADRPLYLLLEIKPFISVLCKPQGRLFTSVISRRSYSNDEG